MKGRIEVGVAGLIYFIFISTVMNLVSSKIMKSSRPLMNRSLETITAFSCQLFIESFKISYRGYVYFLWGSDNSQIHSLRYESVGKNVQVKETLTISIRINSKNGREQTFNTSLKLMTESGEELDQYELQINSLTAQYKEMEVPMDKGLVNLKARRKTMNVGQEEAINLNYRQGLYRSKGGRDEKSMGGAANEYQAMQQQLSRIKKELEDEVYLNNKLKNDRQVLLVTKQQLEAEIETMIIQIAQEISMLRQHYQSRISIREHCYEQDIEDLVNMFNSNAEQSKKVLEVIMKQKMKLEEEIKPLQERVRKSEYQLVEKQEWSQKLQKHKIQIESSLKQSEEQCIVRSKIIEELSQEKKELHQKITQLNDILASQTHQLNKNSNTIDSQDKQLRSLQQKLDQLEFEIDGKDRQINEYENLLEKFREKEEAFINEKGYMQKEIMALEEQKKQFQEEIEGFKQRFVEYQYEMEFNENVIGQLKKQHAQKEDELYEQLQGLQALYAKKMEDIVNNYQKEKEEGQKNKVDFSKEKEELAIKIIELMGSLQEKQQKLQNLEDQIHHLHEQVQYNARNDREKEDTMETLQREVDRLKRQNEHQRASLKQIENVGLSQKEIEQKNVITTQLQREKEQLNNKNANLQKELNNLLAKLEDGQKKIMKLENIKIIMENEKEKQKQEKLEQKKNQMREQNAKKSDGRSNKLQKKYKEDGFRGHRSDKDRQQGQLQQNLWTIEQANEIVHRKNQEIDELRKRVEELESQYNSMQSKFQKIALKYPHIDIDHLDPSLPRQQWCESELEQEKQLNNAFNNQFNSPTNKPARRLTKKESIAQAILQHEEDSYSNHSRKYISHKKMYEPQSEKRIQDDYQNNLKRKESVPGTVTIQVPKNSYRKDNSGSYDPSERSGRSGASYIKVSHSKKIKDLEDQIKQFEDKEQIYKVKIQDYLRNIDSLNHQVENMRGTLQKYGSQKSLKNTFNQLLQIERAKENKQSQVFIEDERIKVLAQQNQGKQLQLQKVTYKLADLQQTLRKEKAEGEKKIIYMQSKMFEVQRREEQQMRKYESLNDTLKQLQKQIAQLQEKLRKQKELAQQARLSAKQITMHLDASQNDLKKMKSLNETLEDKVKKLSGGDMIIRELSKEIEELGKKGLEQTRIINHLKLEKDAIEEELRLIKKRQNDQSRIASEWEEKAASLDRMIDEMKRKETKLKRQVEEGHQEVRRSKLQTKKVEEELTAMGASQASWQVQRRKHLDQISTLQDQLSRKEYEYSKLNKELEKWRIRAEQKDEIRMGRKSQMRQQIDRLESELIRKEKKMLEQTEENKLLRGRLQLLQRQNKRIMQQKNHSYGQKLKYYVEQMSNIKKLLEEYQNENSRLKIDNNDLYEQAQILRINYDKIQIKYEDCMEREENILNDMQSYISENNMLKDRLGQAHSELDQTEAAFAMLRKEADEEKLQVRKLNEKCETTERNLQRAHNDLRELKVKLSEFETNQQINGKQGQKYRALERKKNQLEQQMRKFKIDYEGLINVYIYKREDLQKAVNQTKTHEKRLKQQQIQNISEQCQKLITSKTQRLQQEILDLYNENSKLKSEVSSLYQDYGTQKGRINQLQIMNEKIGPLQSDNDNLKALVQQFKDELRKKTDKLSKFEISFEGISSEYNMKQRELNSLRNRNQQMQKNLHKLNDQIQNRKNNERQLQATINRLTSKQEREKEEDIHSYRQRETQLINQYESRIKQFESQLSKAKQKETALAEQNALKMRKLEQKMEQMEGALKEREKAIEAHYQGQMRQLDNTLAKTSQQLEQRHMRVDELNEAMIFLEGENKDLSHEIQELRYHYEQEKINLENELAKLRNKMKEAQAHHASNIKLLEQQIARNANNRTNFSGTGSRLKTSEAEDRISKRFEEKLKNKDRKIQELKESIFTLEDTIVKLRKKDNSFESTLIEIERIRSAYAELEKQRRINEERFEQDINQSTDIIRELKRQILLMKENEERLKLLADEKTMQSESMTCELKTLRQLYQELQKELEKRKNTLTSQLEEESSLQFQLRTLQEKIIELEEKLFESARISKDLELQIKRKNNEIKKLTDINTQYSQLQEKSHQQISKLHHELNNYKKTIQDMNLSSESSKNELRHTKNELTRLRKAQEDLRTTCINKQQTINELKKMSQEIASRYRQAEEAAHRYTSLNERARQQMGYGIEQLVERFLIGFEDKDGQINQLIEEIEELKFLNERKFLDYDEMKKENFELQMKVEDMDAMSEQVDTLRKICDKLEEQKKNTAFREEVLRVHLQNLANTGSVELRSKIESILSIPTMPLYASFSFY